MRIADKILAHISYPFQCLSFFDGAFFHFFILLAIVDPDGIFTVFSF